MNKRRIVKIISVMLIVVFVASIALAEQRFFPSIPGWGDTWTSSGNVYSLTRTYNGLSAAYALVNLRTWGGHPNPLKDERQTACYNCLSTSTVVVWGGYFGNETAKHFMGYTNPSTGVTSYQTIYTSATGSDSTYTCWFEGC